MNVRFADDAHVSTRLSGWTLAVAAYAVAVAVLLAAYWPTAWTLVWVWAHDGTYQYAFLIFPLSFWVAFSLRHRLQEHRPVPSVWGLVAMAALVCIWYGGHALAVNLPQHFAFVAMFPALVLACWGWRALWVLKFPLVYLVVFAVPWGNGMVGPLQDITARFAVDALQITGVPVLLNGREIVTSAAVFMVAQACSGVKFFIACTALGSLFSYLMYTHAFKRVVFVILAAFVPIVANILRVYFTILIGETFGLQYATGTDHMIFGWQFFGTVLLLLLLVGWFFRDRLPPKRPLVTAQAGAPAWKRRSMWLVGLAVLIAGPVLATTLVAPVTLSRLDLDAPTVVGWSGPQPAHGSWKPTFKGAAGEVLATYRMIAGGTPVELFHAVYTGRPRRGHSLITYGNDIYDHATSRILFASDRHFRLADGVRITAKELRLTGEGGPRLVWYWYCVDHRCTASPVWAKLLQAWQALRGGRPRSSVWALSLPMAGGDASARRARQTLSALAQALPVAHAADAQPVHELTAAGGEP